MAKNLFEKAKEDALYKVCDGCGEKKSIDEFKKTNKYCNNCPHVKEIREDFKKKYLESDNTTISDIDDIDLDEFFKDL
jgi:type I site-specific restriction endonuclease